MENFKNVVIFVKILFAYLTNRMTESSVLFALGGNFIKPLARGVRRKVNVFFFVIIAIVAIAALLTKFDTSGFRDRYPLA